MTYLEAGVLYPQPARIVGSAWVTWNLPRAQRSHHATASTLLSSSCRKAQPALKNLASFKCRLETYWLPKVRP